MSSLKKPNEKKFICAKINEFIFTKYLSFESEKIKESVSKWRQWNNQISTLMSSVVVILSHIFFQANIFKYAHKVPHAVLEIWNIGWVNGPTINSKKLWITKRFKWPIHSKQKLTKFLVREQTVQQTNVESFLEKLITKPM